MFKVCRHEIIWGDRKLSLETGKMARQADGSVVVQYGDTVVLCTVCVTPEAKKDISFLPLSVHYQEKTFAVGKIPGSFFKREGRPSEKEILVSRLIDRSLRPLFPAHFFNEVQVICTVLSHDLANDPDIPALIGASAALTLSGVPFLGPVAAARIGYVGGEYLLNPVSDQMKQSQLDLVVAGTSEGTLMVESEAQELSEAVMLGAVHCGQADFRPVLKMIVDLAEQAAKDPWALANLDCSKDIEAAVRSIAHEPLRKIYQEKNKAVRGEALTELKKKLFSHLESEHGWSHTAVAPHLKKVAHDIVRAQVLEFGHRIDGRDVRTVRPISCEVGVLPSAHGSALFTRGDTQALAVTTLGTNDDSQVMDTLEGEYKETFLLHYNFPQFSVGEVGRVGPPGRREVGHGKLAWRAIHPLMPDSEAFPYTVRVVSEILESDGSSSMATVCGSSLALMDAGVLLPRPVAGIAMGLIKEGDRFQVLSDILGDEDSLGDMDFKVAGTVQGITALQMDIKITSVTPEIMKVALEQALEGRLHILQEMGKALDLPRKVLNGSAPRILTFRVAKEKIREIIGPGGKVIREICDATGAKIDIQDDGTVQVFSSNAQGLDDAVSRIRAIAYEPQIGDIFDGTVVKTTDFGAFVNFTGKQDGLVHISELAPHRVESVEDVVKVGDKVRVKIIGNAKGKIKLSMKQIDGESSSQPMPRAG